MGALKGGGTKIGLGLESVKMRAKSKKNRNGRKMVGQEIGQTCRIYIPGTQISFEKKYFGPKILEVIGLKFSGLDPSRHLD